VISSAAPPCRTNRARRYAAASRGVARPSLSEKGQGMSNTLDRRDVTILAENTAICDDNGGLKA
jgi:hypothetical protein